jgi:hypothetical protein
MGCAALTLAVCVGFLASASVAGGADAPPPDLTIAFIGDQDVGADAEAVLQLIIAQGSDAVVHSGDLGYEAGPPAWEAQIDAFLGPDFPYFASVGNHDDDWYGPNGYQVRLAARMLRLGIEWQGDLGVQSSLRWNGVFIVLTAPDVVGDGDGFHDLYIRDQLAADDSIWSISSWHRNMRLMQVGDKSDDTGWGVYEQSRRGGAIVATAHEHSYSRTHQMSSFETQQVASFSSSFALAEDDPNTPVDEGRSFAFVSGLGGRSIRDQELDGEWWASIYTDTQNANFGALFGVFAYGGDPHLARFYFKDIDGTVVDEFFVRSADAPAAPVPSLGVPGALLLGALLCGMPRRRIRYLRFDGTVWTESQPLNGVPSNVSPVTQASTSPATSPASSMGKCPSRSGKPSRLTSSA